MSELIDLTNKQFGRLTVISYIGKCHWKCQCQCGKIKNIYTQNLKNGGIKSCGCWRKEISQRGHKPFQSLYKRLVWNSKKEGITITLTFDNFLEFTKTNKCHYCGDTLIWQPRNRGRYNLDRKDSQIGYTNENCVVCCKECNYAKNNYFTYEEMLIIGKTIEKVKQNRVNA